MTAPPPRGGPRRSRGSHLAALVVVLAGVSLAPTGAAQTCPPAHRAWVEAAARATGLALSPQMCSPTVVVVEIGGDGHPPLSVEVAAPPGQAFRMAGGLRVSPVAEIADWSAQPPALREDFDTLAGWLDQHAPDTGLGSGSATPGAPPAAPRPTTAPPWTLLAALALATATLRRPPRRVDAAVVLTLLALGWALRQALGLFAPLHANGQGPLWIRAALDSPTLVAGYGPGFPELYGWLLRTVDGDPGPWVFGANALAGALLAPLTWVLGVRLGLGRPRALVAALVLSLDPIAIRTSATEAYTVPVAVLAAGALLALVSATSLALAAQVPQGQASTRAGPSRGGSWWRGALRAAAGGLLAGAAVRVHPAALAPIALLPLAVVAVAAATDAPHRRRGMAVAAVLAIACGALAAAAWPWLLPAVGQASAASAGGAHVSAGEATDLALAAAALVAATRAALRSPHRPVALVGIAASVVALATYRTYAHAQLFQDASLAMFAPLIALGAAALPRGRATALLVAAPIVVPLVILQVRWAPLRAPSTERLEYAWLADHLRDIPPSCRLAHPRRVGYRVLEIPDYAAPGRRAAVGMTDPEALRALAVASPCVVWVHTSICSTNRGRPLCDAVERSAPLRELASQRLPGLRSFWLPYDRSTVDVRLLQVERQDVMAGAPGETGER